MKNIKEFGIKSFASFLILEEAEVNMNGLKPSEIYCVVDYNSLNSSSAIVSLFDSLDGAKKESERMNQDFNSVINSRLKRKYPFIERYRAETLEKGIEQIVEYINDGFSSQEPGY